MKKFVYPFERLLKLKKLNEKIKQKELVGFLSSKAQLEKEITVLNNKLLQIKINYMQNKIIKVIELQKISAFEKNVNATITFINEKILLLNEKINLTKTQLLDLMRERKVLESLKEKKLSDYLKEYSKTIDTEATDLFLMRRSHV